MAVKRLIRYKNIDNEPVEKEWYFNLNKADMLDMDLAYKEDVQTYLQDILKAKNARELIALWRELLINSVGERKNDNLVKSNDIREEFRYGGAFEELLSELLEETDAGASFFVSMLPAEIQKDISEEQAKVYSKDELLAMSPEEFDRVAGTDPMKMSVEHMQIAYIRKTSPTAAA